METRKCFAGVVAAVGIVLLGGTPFTRGQNCPEQVDKIWVFTGQFFEPHRMEVSSSHAYVLGNSSDMWGECLANLTILDVSDPEGPRIEGQVSDCGRAGCDFCPTHLGVSGHRVFTIERGGSRLDLTDVSDPSNPKLNIGFYQFDGNGEETTLFDIEVSGDLIHLVSSDGLRILDVSDIENPAEVGFFESSWEPSSFAVSGGYAYVFDAEAGLRIIDVSDSAQIHEVGNWPSTLQAYEIEASGDFAYLAAGREGLRIVSVADPEHPIEVAAVETYQGVVDVSVDGSLVSIAVGVDGVALVDVSNPSTPSEVDLYGTDGSALNVVLHGPAMYVLEGGDGWGFRVVDVSTPERPTEYSSVDFDQRTVDVAVSENTRYFANGDLGVLVQNPPDVWRAWLDTPGFARGVTPYGQYLLVADDHKGLRVIDTSDLSRLVEVGYLDTPGQAQRIAVAGDYAFVADGDGGLRIIDVSQPTSPEEVGFLDTPGPAMDVAISGDWAYVADGPGSLRVIDVSDPSQPIERNDTWKGGFLAVAGQYLVTAGGDELNLLNISDPASPDYIYERGYLPGESTDLAVVGNHAFVSTRSDGRGEGGGVTVFDISLPSNPVRKIGTWDFTGDVTGIAVSEGYVYAATGESQVHVLDTRCLTTYWVELVAHQPGLRGSHWRSDIVIMQQPEGWFGQSRFDVSVEFVLHTRDGVFTGDGAVPPLSTAVFEDIVGLLGYEGKGSLEIRAESPIWVSSRVYSLTDSGTSGAYLPGYRSSECLGEDQSAYLLGLRQEEDKYRTNISVTNVSDETRRARIFLLSADGTELGGFTVWVEPGMSVQEIQPFKNRVNRPNLGWGSALIDAPSGGILTSATVIDSRTNDAVVVPMTRVPEWIYKVK